MAIHGTSSYEVVWEIFNLCPNNQMRDVFIDEIETEDPESYVRRKIQDKEVRLEKAEMKDGVVIYDIYAADVHERMTFTPF